MVLVYFNTTTNLKNYKTKKSFLFGILSRNIWHIKKYFQLNNSDWQPQDRWLDFKKLD